MQHLEKSCGNMRTASKVWTDHDWDLVRVAENRRQRDGGGRGVPGGHAYPLAAPPRPGPGLKDSIGHRPNKTNLIEFNSVKILPEFEKKC